MGNRAYHANMQLIKSNRVPLQSAELSPSPVDWSWRFFVSIWSALREREKNSIASVHTRYKRHKM